MRAVLQGKGRVTIPKRCGDELGLRPGAVLDFEAVEGRLVAREVQSRDVIGRWRGKGRIPGGLSVDGYLAMIRGGSLVQPGETP